MWLLTSDVTMKWWLLMVLFVGATATECPAVCECVYRAVHCRSRSLAQVPTEGISPHATIWDFSHNNLTSLGHDTFQAFTHTIAIDLSSNQIVNVSSNAFSHMDHVGSINLSANNITHIEFRHVGSDSLSALYLSHNPHLRLPEHGFKLRHLKILEMKHCGLAHIPGHFFAHAQSIEVLELGHNRFSSLDAHTFSHLSRLVYLDLSGNKFVRLPSGLLQHLDVAVHVKLEANPFVCECKTHHEYASYVVHRGVAALHCSHLDTRYQFTAFYSDHCSPGSPALPASEASPPQVVEALPSGSPTDHRGVVVAATLSAILVAAFVVTVAVRLRRNVRLREPSPQRFSILKGFDEV